MMKSKTVGTDLTTGPIFRNLFIFAIPIILTNLVQQLYSMVDLAVIGQFVGSIGSVGVSTGGEIADLVSPIALSFSTAGQIYVAQLAGAKMEDEVKSSIGTLITLSILVSFGLMAIAIIFCHPILNLLNCPEEAMEQATQYMIITALGYPFIFGYNAVVGALRGMGESKRPMYFIMIAAVINIFMDILLVTVIPLQAAGTAIATVLSQIGSCFASFYYMYKHRDEFDFELKLSYFKLNGRAARILVKLSIPQIARSMMVRFSMLWVNANVNAYGLTVSATNSIGTKIQKFLEIFIQGVDTASAAMIGQNLGAHQTERAGRTVWCTLALTMTFAGISIILSLTIPDKIFRLLTTDPEVIELGRTYMRIICFHFIFSAITTTFQSMVTGCGYVSLGFLIGILDGVVCRIGISLFFYYVLNAGYESYWWGTALARVLPGVLCFAYYMSGKWKTRRLLTEE